MLLAFIGATEILHFAATLGNHIVLHGMSLLRLLLLTEGMVTVSSLVDVVLKLQHREDDFNGFRAIGTICPQSIGFAVIVEQVT